MSEINNRFRVKKGLDVQGGDASFSGNVDVAGSITVPTPATNENSTKVATTAFVITAINNLINGAPGALDTLNELATALGNDPNFATTVTNQLALKAPLDSPALTGTPTAPTASNGDDSSTIATTAFVKNQAYAPVTSPALVGIPTAPTAAVGTNTTQLSTTAFVQAALAAYGVGSTATAIPGGTTGSIDSATIPSGIYQVTSSNAGTKPFSDISGFLIVMQGSGSSVIHQMYYDDTTARMFSRAYASSAWTAWREAAYLDSPAFSGTPTAPTAAVDTNTTQVATAEFVLGQAASAAPIMDGVATVGTSTRFARQDHIHPTDTSRAPLASPALTGIPTAPTAAPNTNSTQLATTAYADAIAALKANISNPAFTGSATFAGSLSSSDYTSFPFVNGGSYNSSTASVTGSVKIKLPVAYTSTMVSFDIDIIEGPTDSAFKIRVSGFLASSSSTWSGVTVNQVGGVNSRLPNVRFGNDGTNSCIWVGELTDTWAYPNISVSNVHVGYGGLTSAWQGAWSIAFVATFDTVKVGPIAANKAAYLNSPAFTGRITVAGAADDGSNVLQLNGSMRAANYYINGQATGDSGVTGFGNANGPGIAYYGSGTAGSGSLVFRTANTERARFNSAGRLLIGTTSDDGSNALQISGNISLVGAAPTITFNAGGPVIWSPATKTIAFNNGSSEVFRANANGRMLIGGTVDDGSNLLQIYGDTSSNGGVVRSTRYGQYGAFVAYSALGSYSAPTAINLSTTIGAFIARGYDGAAYRDVGSINVVSDGLITSSNSSGYITLSTTPSGSVTSSERMRIVSAGRILINTTTDDGVTQLQINGIATATTPTVGDISTKVATTSFTQQTADNSAIVYSIVFG